MDHLEHIMGLYDEGLEELMGAQNYVKKMYQAISDDEKNMYRVLARQELDHAQMLVKDGDKLTEKDDAQDMVKRVWHYLRSHLLDWHSDLHSKVS